MATLLLTAVIALQIPAVQTAVARRALDRTLSTIRGRVEIGNISFYPFNTLIIKDIALIDDAPMSGPVDVPQDTLFRARTIAARFTIGGILTGNPLKFRKVEVDDGRLAMVIEPDPVYKTNLNRMFGIVPQEKKEKSTKDVLSIKKIICKNFNFRMISYADSPEEYSGVGMNWNDLDAWADYAEATDFKIANSIISAKARKVVAREKSGFNVQLSGEVQVGRGRTEIDHLKFADGISDIDLESFTMNYLNQKSFSRFIDEVKLGATFNRTLLAFETLSYFAPVFNGKTTILDIEGGRVSGYVKDLNVDNLTFSDITGDLRGRIDGSVIGLPKARSLILDCGLYDFDFTTAGLNAIVSQWTEGNTTDLSRYAPSERFTFNAKADGTIANLIAGFSLASAGAGSAGADIFVRNIVNTQDIVITGDINTTDLNIGRIIGKDFIKECTLATEVKATLTRNSPTVRIDTLNISRLNVLDYDYTGIRATGKYTGDAFDGRVVCDDPSLNFMFQGLINLAKNADNALYRFYATLGYADLHAMHIDKRPVSSLSVGSINANYTTRPGGELAGTIDAGDIRLTNSQGTSDIGDIRINSRSAEAESRVDVISTFANARYRGASAIGTMLKEFKAITLEKEAGALFGKGAAPSSWTSGACRLDLDFNDTRGLLSYFAPGVFVADSSSIRLRVNEQGRFTGKIGSRLLALKDKYVKDASLTIDNGDDALNLTLTGSEISLTPKLFIRDNTLTLYAQDNIIGLGYTFDNGEGNDYRADLYLTADISDSRPGDPVVTARTFDSSIQLGNEVWTIKPSSFLYTKDGMKFDQVEIGNDKQLISIDGGFSPTAKDVLNVEIRDIDISGANQLTRKNLELAGLFSGHATLESPIKDGMALMMTLRGDEVCVAGLPVGSLRLVSTWDDTAKRINCLLRNTLNGSTSLDASCFYTPSTKNIDADVHFTGFNFGYASPFLDSVFSEMGGNLSGHVAVDGTPGHLHFSSRNLYLADAPLTVAFTKVPYYVDGPLHLDNDGLHFDSVSIRDITDGNGTIRGGILFNGFKNIAMDTRIRLDNIEVLRTTERDNQSFYGTVFGSGRLNITGPFSDLLLDIDASTTKRSDFHIPLNSSKNGGSGHLLVFKEAGHKAEYLESYEKMLQNLAETHRKQSDLGVKLRVHATPDVNANLEIDKSLGNVLTGNGEGTISLDVRPAKEIFAINGDYTLNGGHFIYNAMGLARKEFSILEGSSIKFNGDIMESDLDINARYNVKASLASLIADTTSVTSRKMVNCDLNISKKLKSPQLSFSIDVPDLDPTVKSQVESALSTEDKIQRQFIALLVMNNFLPDEQSGVVNNSNLLYSNVANIMANQLNNIFMKLDIPVDLGLKYQENNSGRSIFDVALSTQLFNNRVSVNGNIGNRQKLSGYNTQDVVGDLDIEVKLDKSGKVRATMFSHSADDYTNFLDLTQRNGVGVAYQREFDTLGEFFRDLFSSRKKKQERMEERVESPEERKKIIIE